MTIRAQCDDVHRTIAELTDKGAEFLVVEGRGDISLQGARRQGQRKGEPARVDESGELNHAADPVLRLHELERVIHVVETDPV